MKYILSVVMGLLVFGFFNPANAGTTYKCVYNLGNPDSGKPPKDMKLGTVSTEGDSVDMGVANRFRVYIEDFVMGSDRSKKALVIGIMRINGKPLASSLTSWGTKEANLMVPANKSGSKILIVSCKKRK